MVTITIVQELDAFACAREFGEGIRLNPPRWQCAGVHEEFQMSPVALGKELVGRIVGAGDSGLSNQRTVENHEPHAQSFDGVELRLVQVQTAGLRTRRNRPKASNEPGAVRGWEVRAIRGAS